MSNVRFGINNYVKNCTITSVPTAVVTADNLKTEWRARQGKWNDFSAANQPAAALLSGDRTSLITVGKIGTVADFSTSTGANLVDGASGADVTDAWHVHADHDGTDCLDEGLSFDLAESYVLTTMTLTLNASGTNGTFKARGSNDLTTFVDLTEGQAVTSTSHTWDFSTNTTAYRYYCLCGTDGTWDDSVWWQEITFTAAPAIVIEGVMTTTETSEFFSIVGSNIAADSYVQLELFATDVSSVDLLDMGSASTGQAIPLGLWSAGFDAYGDSSQVAMGNIYTNWFNSTITWQRFRLTVIHAYSTAAPVANTTIRQDSAGLLSLEAESGAITDVGSDVWTDTFDALASDTQAMVKTGPTFFRNSADGPRVNYTFTASQSGTHELWFRMKSYTLANSVYTIFDGSSKTTIRSFHSGWDWVKIRDVTLTAEQDHTLIIAARDYTMEIDKIVIQPATTADPTSTGPAISTVGTVASGENISIRMLMIGNRVDLDHNFSQGNSIEFVDSPSLAKTASGFSVSSKLQNQTRKMSLPLNVMTEADGLKMIDLEIAMRGQTFLVSAYPDAAEWVEKANTMLGLFETPLKHTHRVGPYFSTTLNIVEA